MGSMQNQRLLLALESTPGVPVTSGMKRPFGLKATPAWSVEGESFKGGGSKVATNLINNNVTGAPGVEVTPDYNGWTWAMTGAFGAPVSGAYEDSTVAHEHAFVLNKDAEDTKATFPAVWGKSGATLQMPFFTFNGFGATIGRSSVTTTASALSSAPIPGVAMPSSATDVPAVPIAGRTWRVYIDDAWDDLGTAKNGGATGKVYEATINMEGKYSQDLIVDADVASFDDLIESDSTTYTLSLNLGFKQVALDMLGDFEEGALKYIRLESVGPEIESGVNYRATLDFCVVITDPGQITTAPNSPSVVLPFNCELHADPVTGNVAEATLINTVSSL